MSIYIEGMNMPTKQIIAVINPDGLVEILNSDNILIEEFQATQVPPHGRLIEAEAAKESLKPIDSLFCYEPEWTWGELYESNCAAIDKLPTIFSAEEGE